MSTLIKTGKSIFNALAFANVNSLNELRTQLQQLDESAGATAETKQARTISAAARHFDAAPIVRHVQGAL